MVVTGDGLSLTVLGSSGTYAGPGQACSGYLVRAGGTSVWLDTGPGTLGAVQHHVPLQDLDAVVLSHSHPDHWLELPVLRNALAHVIGREGLVVHGTDACRRQAAQLIGPGLERTFRWHTIADRSTFAIGPLRFTCSATDHPVETLAVRVDAGGRSLAYSADTGAGWSVIELGEGIDLFVCEASLPLDLEDSTQHLSARQAGAMAAAAGVDRLVITHVVPGVDPRAQLDAASAAFGGPVELAEPGRTYPA